MDPDSSAKTYQPQFSIVIAVMNGAKTLNRCIESILIQKNKQWELIVIDGGSTDGTIPIIRSYEAHITYWESRPDRGIYHAWNKALKHARGEWICFLGADDFFWDAHVLSNLTPHLETAASRGVKIVYGRVVKVDAHGSQLKILGKPWPKIRWLMPHGMPLDLPHPGMMHHCSLFERYGFFDETFRISGDYEFLLRELKNNQALFANGLKTVGQRAGGIADSFKLLAHREVARARQKNGLKHLSWVWLAVYTRAILRAHWLKMTRRPERLTR